MRARQRNELSSGARLLDTEELRMYVGLGRNTAIELAETAGARVAIGKRILFDRVKLDQYLDELTGVES